MGEEEVAEELLKNLPGVKVSSDGTVSFEDKPIEKVEVYQRYSHNKL